MKQLDKVTSEQLLTELLTGNSVAFDEIYHRYRRKVYGYALHFTRSRDEAEELTQDVFVRLWENKHKIDPAKNFDAFLYTLIRNNFLGTLRKKAKATVFRNDTLQEEPYINSTEDYMDFKECQDIAGYAIETLSPQVKVAYQLSRDKGQSHEDISLQMGISKNTVNNHIKKSLKIIRTCFGAYSPETILSLLLLAFF